MKRKPCQNCKKADKLFAAMLIKITIFFALAILLTALVCSRAHAAGTTTGEFLRLGAGARYVGTGDTGAAVANDANATYWNPAQLTQVKEPQVTASYNAYVAGINYQYFGYAERNVGLSVQSLSYGSVQRVDVNGQEIGRYDPRDVAVSLAGAQRVHGINLGLTGKYINSRILKSASTYAFDAGASKEAGRARFAAVVKNVGRPLTFETGRDPLPLSLNLGAAYHWTKSLVIATEGVKPRGSNPYYGVGLEKKLPLDKGNSVALRGGFNTRSKDVPGSIGASFGLGLKMKRVDVDYAFLPFGDLDLTHRLTVNLRFGGWEPSKPAQPRKPTLRDVPEASLFLPLCQDWWGCE